ncbi:MAG: hypothetical protein K2H88_03650, partial [Duncaniella sp.]|nr:hypothetical protein [Duncaniella sp.]
MKCQTKQPPSKQGLASKTQFITIQRQNTFNYIIGETIMANKEFEAKLMSLQGNLLNFAYM